jgi:hypothetical protein
VTAGVSFDPVLHLAMPVRRFWSGLRTVLTLTLPGGTDADTSWSAIKTACGGRMDKGLRSRQAISLAVEARRW